MTLPAELRLSEMEMREACVRPSHTASATPTGIEAALRERFISGMSHVAGTVFVVATDGPAGRAGMTISAMSSISADGERPTLLVCLNQNSNTWRVLRKNKRFTLNILNASHVDVANAFAARTSDATDAKFGVGTWVVNAEGLPELSDAGVVFSCRTCSIQEIGTHAVVVGEVEAVREGADTKALLYYRRAYVTPVD